MGQAAKTKAKFISDHPFCCFCGGASQTTTIDHVPNRAFFIARQWPVGFQFPACDACQGGARVSELVCAAIARSWSVDDPSAVTETTELWRGLAKSDTETFKEMIGPERISGLHLSEMIWSRLRTKNGLPLMILGPRVHGHLDQYINKLTKALYYKHTNKIVPSTANLVYLLASNADIGSDQERMIAEMRLPNVPELLRHSPMKDAAPLANQLNYSFGYLESSGHAIFRVRMHQTFIFASSVMINGPSG